MFFGSLEVWGVSHCGSVCVSHSVMSDSMTPLTVAHQAPLSMEFSRQECWSGLLFPSLGSLPNPGIEPGSPALQADSYHLSYQGSPMPVSKQYTVWFLGLHVRFPLYFLQFSHSFSIPFFLLLTLKLFTVSHVLWTDVQIFSLCAKLGTEDSFPSKILELCDSCLQIFVGVIFQIPAF